MVFYIFCNVETEAGLTIRCFVLLLGCFGFCCRIRAFFPYEFDRFISAASA